MLNLSTFLLDRRSTIFYSSGLTSADSQTSAAAALVARYPKKHGARTPSSNEKLLQLVLGSREIEREIERDRVPVQRAQRRIAPEEFARTSRFC